METFGKATARKLFELRGNPETVLLSEEQVAGLIDTAIDFTRAPHKHVWTSELGWQGMFFGAIACECGNELPYQRPIEPEQEINRRWNVELWRRHA